MPQEPDSREQTHPELTPSKETGELLAAVVRASDDAITLQAFDGRILAWNRGAERMYGYTEAEALEMNISAIYPDFNGKTDRQMARRLERGGTVDSFETQRRTKDGRILDVWLTATVLRDQTDKPYAFSTTERDITERKKAELALHESEERLRVSLMSLPVMMFSQDLQLRYTWIYHSRPPFDRADALGKTDWDMLSAEDAERRTEIKERVLQTGVGAREDIEMSTPGLEKRYYDLTVEPLRDSTGAIVGITGTSLDVTQRYEAARQLQEAREALESRVERRMAGGTGYGLTFRELTVLHLVADGMANKEIAVQLGISPLTAQKHLQNILDKMGAGSRTEAGVRAVREQLVE